VGGAAGLARGAGELAASVAASARAATSLARSARDLGDEELGLLADGALAELKARSEEAGELLGQIPGALFGGARAEGDGR